ncbi:MAG: cobalamin biosynthesis protein CobG [Allobranchiibius sp.]
MTSRARPPGGDRCPGVLRPYVTGDGALVRLRLPGGRVRIAVLAELMSLAGEFGAPVLQVTSRANLQLRALPDPLPEAFIERIEATGLLPSATHERVRNILAAPLAPNLQPLVEALDGALTGDPGLAELPGRFLFALSDETGSVLSEGWDLAYQSLSADRGLVLAGDYAIDVAQNEAVSELICRAHLFLEHRSGPDVWNIDDLPADSVVFDRMHPHVLGTAGPLEPGPVGDDLLVGVPLSMLRPTQLDALVAVTHELVLTPWRSFVVPGGARHAAQLVEAGFTVTRESPWARLTACVGAPSCARTQTRTLDLATDATTQMRAHGPRVHVVGCERRCGEPPADHVTLVSPADADEIVRAANEPVHA